ncbi:MAG: LVIVD repeat-containing protein [Candidatus Sumerlaeaceae bacterium]
MFHHSLMFVPIQKFSGLALSTLLLVAELLVTSCAETRHPQRLSRLQRKELWKLEKIGQLPLKRARAVALVGNRAFVAQNFQGLSEVDISSPAAPRLLRHVPPASLQPLHIVESSDGRYLFVADRFRGFLTLRADNLSTYAALPLEGIATKIHLFYHADKAYAAVACGGGGLRILDVTNPLAPNVVSSFTLGTDYATDVCLAGHLALLANNDEGGLEMFRVADPALLQPLQRISLPGYCVAVQAAPPLFAAALRNGGFAILRTDAISMPRTEIAETSPPVELLSLVNKFPDYAQDICFLPHDLFAVANNENGIQLYNLADPAIPQLEDSMLVGGEVVALRWRDPYLHACAWDAGFVIMRLVKQTDSAAALSREDDPDVQAGPNS